MLGKLKKKKKKTKKKNNSQVTWTVKCLCSLFVDALRVHRVLSDRSMRLLKWHVQCGPALDSAVWLQSPHDGRPASGVKGKKRAHWSRRSLDTLTTHVIALVQKELLVTSKWIVPVVFSSKVKEVDKGGRSRMLTSPVTPPQKKKNHNKNKQTNIKTHRL